MVLEIDHFSRVLVWGALHRASIIDQCLSTSGVQRLPDVRMSRTYIQFENKVSLLLRQHLLAGFAGTESLINGPSQLGMVEVFFRLGRGPITLSLVLAQSSFGLYCFALDCCELKFITRKLLQYER